VISPGLLAVIAVGALVGAGAVLLVWALTPREPSETVGPRSSLRDGLTRLGARLPLAFGAGLVVLVLTSWPVLAVATGTLAFVGPSLVGGAAAERRAMARLEGLATWTESLRDTIAGAVGLEQAIPATAYAAAPAIRRELAVLSDRLRVRTPLPQALQRFADDLDDAGADLIVAALILNAQLRGPGLRKVLSSLAESTREELEMRRRINAGRASTRRSVQIVVGVTVLFVFGLSIFNRGYVEPYTSPAGQLMLVLILALFAAGFWWMKRLSAFELPERFLFTDATARGQR
jgi:Flp pilus assembly protein TadB